MIFSRDGKINIRPMPYYTYLTILLLNNKFLHKKIKQAVLKCGTVLELKNVNNKTAFDYMEDIEQLNSMFNAHYPGLWAAVEKFQVKNVEKLMNGIILVLHLTIF